jgi:putative hydrolase of the HAD superfamily
MLETLIGGAILTVLGVALTVATSSHTLRRRLAIRQALARTPGANRALRTAVRSTRDELRASAASGEVLLSVVGNAMGPQRDDELVAAFLTQLRKRFVDHNMELAWVPPSAGRRPSPRRRQAETQMIGRTEELASLRNWIADGVQVVIAGPPGIGKTTLLQALNAEIPDAVTVRLGQGGQPLRDLRLALHRYCPGEFPVDDDQGIDVIARGMPEGTVLLIDNAEDEESAAAVMRLVGHLGALTVVVATRGQAFPGFRRMELAPLPQEEAITLLEGLGLPQDQQAEVLDRADGNPLLLLQTGWAAKEGTTLDDDNRLGRLLDRLGEAERRALWIIGDLPSATVPTALLVEVGGLTKAGFDLLRKNAVLQRTATGHTVHETLRVACRDLLTMVPRDMLDQLRASMGRHYVNWLGSLPDLDQVDIARPNLMHLVSQLRDDDIRADLILALVGDNLDDPRGYIPARGLSSLLLEQRETLMRTANAVGGVRAAHLEKNLGLFLYLANDSSAREVLLSARARYHVLNDENGQAAATWVLGYIADDSSQYTEAESLYRAPLEYLRDDAVRAISHHLVGCSLYHQGRPEDARREFTHAQTLTKDVSVHARIQRRLAYIELAFGDTDRAIRLLERARNQSQLLNRPRDVARISRHLGIGWIRLNNLRKAEEELLRAEQGFRAVGEARGLGSTLRDLATVCRLQGRLGRAGELALGSRTIARGQPDSPMVPMTSPFGAAAADEELGRIALAAGDKAAATRHLRSACNTFEAIRHARAVDLAAELAATVGRDATIPRPRAILFDLVDTLAITEHEAYENAKRHISAGIGVDHERFKSVWARSRKQASTDPTWTAADRIQWVARKLDMVLSADLVADLAEREHQLWASSVRLKPDALPVLAELRERGIRMLLVSNGSTAMRGLPETLGLTKYLEGSVLSCEARALKPDEAIYRQALSMLDLPAEDCIYVGDGNDRELEGARAVGIFAVRILTSGMPRYDSTKSLDWDATVTSLSELVRRIGS